MDLGFQGKPMTWNNKHLGLVNIQQRSNWILGNDIWHDTFPNSTLTHPPSLISDPFSYYSAWVVIFLDPLIYFVHLIARLTTLISLI